MTWRAISARLWTRGNCAARVNLAWCYVHGKGVDKNAKESGRLIRAAGEQVDDEWHIVVRWLVGEMAAMRRPVEAVGHLEYVAGVYFRTSTRPTLNILPILRASV